MTSDRVALRWAGILFLLAFPVYGIGMGLTSAVLEAADPVGALAAQRTPYLAGLGLMALNSFLVVGIGAFCFRPLAPRSRSMARCYLLARIGEGLALLVGTLLLARLLLQAPTPEGVAIAHRGSMQAYHLGMAILGMASVVWCGFLYRQRVIVRWLAGWGVAGYALFAFGSVGALAGLGDGLVLSIPGGLFEMFFALGLIFRPSLWNPARSEPEAPGRKPA